MTTQEIKTIKLDKFSNRINSVTHKQVTKLTMRKKLEFANTVSKIIIDIVATTHPTMEDIKEWDVRMNAADTVLYGKPKKQVINELVEGLLK